MADYNDFLTLDIRVGQIVACEEFPEARQPAYKLSINFGTEIGTKRSSAQITDHYQVAELIGRQVLAVVNLPVKQIGHYMSECLTLGVPDADGHVILLMPERDVVLGGRMF
jgi:tRNA-binding protein